MKEFWKKEWFLWAVYTLAAVVVSIQKLTQGERPGGYTFYENYIIFKNSFPHLLQGLNPYADFPAEQWDLFKYSPAFALFMAPFAALPDWLGLPCWNLLNALVLLAAILHLPILTRGQRIFSAWFVLIELITSMQNSQSNGLTAGLMLWAFIAFEQKKPSRATGFITAAAYIKIFGIFAAVLALLYPGKRRFAFWLIGWTAFFALVPLLILSPAQLGQVYEWWMELLRNDHEASVGLSVQGWLLAWFGWAPSKTGVTLTGLLLLLASVLAVSYPGKWITGRFIFPKSQASALHRALACASVLIWVVIFNHKAESPTFIIAMCGVVLWWQTANKTTWENALLWATFMLVSLSPTDIFPKALRQQIVQPYVLKALPCIVIWIIITWKLFSGRGREVKRVQAD